jgi:hypothetical protein
MVPGFFYPVPWWLLSTHCTCQGDLKLPEVILQFASLSEDKLVPHLLDRIHAAHAECVEVFADL